MLPFAPALFLVVALIASPYEPKIAETFLRHPVPIVEHEDPLRTWFRILRGNVDGSHRRFSIPGVHDQLLDGLCRRGVELLREQPDQLVRDLYADPLFELAPEPLEVVKDVSARHGEV